MSAPEYSRIVSLGFPPPSSGKPVMSTLAKLYELTFNVLQANINPRREGHMVLELSGTRQGYRQGVAYLEEQGIRVTPVAHQISRDEDSCMHCGFCTALCPSQALVHNQETRQVDFHHDRCTACTLCVTICPVHVMHIEADSSLF